MPVTILLGTQWGDEGKGKATDWLADSADIIARYNGGDNAGHTLNVEGVTYKLHFLPSGVVRPGLVSLMGGGMAIHPQRLLAEMQTVSDQGLEISPERLKLATNAHLITPAHQALEAAQETVRGAGKIGTTGRGIGPAYTSKIARDGIRAASMGNPEAFADEVHRAVEVANTILTGAYGAQPLDADAIAAEYADYARQLQPFLVEGWAFLRDALAQGKQVLAEGGQATLLDIDHGTYPFVTSSNPTAGGALTGLGIGPGAVERVVGVAKAFTSRVGAGPFPTELDNEFGAMLRGDGSQPWDEYGTTTRRPRRCGWLDLVLMRYAVAVNGLTELALSKLDVLSQFEQIEVAVAYEIDGQRLDDFPVDQSAFARALPIYETLPGWDADIMGVTHWEDLPAAARGYVEWIETQVGIPVTLVGVGPGREQTLLRV
ncbi:MAG: adenylosuccinate synthase [Chloroflexi bacterium]|nr:adenylosuccinate synthase [Chloroflexota bacterium]